MDDWKDMETAAGLPAPMREAGQVALYEPSARQTAFQALADALCSVDLGMVQDWIMVASGRLPQGALSESQQEEVERLAGCWALEPVSASEWSAWMRERGFRAWFYDGLTMLARPSEDDYKSLDGLFLRRLRDGLQDRSHKDHYGFSKLYAQIAGHLDRQQQDVPTVLVELSQRGDSGQVIDIGAAWRPAEQLSSKPLLTDEGEDG